MTNENRDSSYSLMMNGERLDMMLGERRGLKAEMGKERNALLLTDRRVVRLSKAGPVLEESFVSLMDVEVAEVRLMSRGIKPLMRIALLLAGACSALVTIPLFPLALALAAILGLSGFYYLLKYVTASKEGAVAFRTESHTLEIPFRGNMLGQVYTFINRFFQLKAAAPAMAERDEAAQAQSVPMEVGVPEGEASGLGMAVESGVEVLRESEEETAQGDVPARNPGGEEERG